VSDNIHSQLIILLYGKMENQTSIRCLTTDVYILTEFQHRFYNYHMKHDKDNKHYPA